MRKLFISASYLVALIMLAQSARATILERGGTSPGVKLEKLQIYSTVKGRGARTTLYMTFRNSSHARRAQATMLFPLPDGAAVQRLRLKVGDKWMEGEVVGRVQGKAVYDRLYRRRVDPALLAQAGDNRYRLRVFPIPAMSTMDVEITFWHVLPEEDGVLFWELPFDMIGVDSQAVRTAASLTMSCSGLGKSKITLPTWRGAAVKAAGKAYTITCPKENIELTGTIQVSIKPGRRPAQMLARRSGRVGHYYLEVRPELPVKAKALPRRFVFCLDRSGSMQGDKIRQARDALISCIQALRPIDEFNVVAFSGEVDTFTKKMETVAETSKSALRYVKSIQAGGSTDIRGACVAALKLDAKGDQPLDIILISDGQQTVGASSSDSVLAPIKAAAARRKTPVRLSVVGIGGDVDAALLRKLSTHYEGESVFVTKDHAVAGQIESVLAQLQAMRMERVKVSIAGAGAALATPRYFRNVLFGKFIPVAGTYEKAGKLTVTLRWNEGARERTWKRTFQMPERKRDYQGVPLLMANAYANALEAEISGTANESERLHMVMSTGHRYRLVTRYTSLIALETDALYRQQGVARPERDALGISMKAKAGNINEEKRFTGAKIDPRDNPNRARHEVVNPGPIARRPVYDEKKKRDIFKNTRTVQADTTVNRPVVVTERPPVVFETRNDAASRGTAGTADGVSDMPMGGTGVTGHVGVGGGGMAGSFGYRGGGGRRRAVARFGGSRATERGVEAALNWLRRHQQADGSWDAAKFGASVKVKGESTALATLAFLGAGYTSKTGKYREKVARAIKWIADRQQANGSFKTGDGDAYRTHALLTLALCEAYGMTRDRHLYEPAQQAVKYALSIQKKHSGWAPREGAAVQAVTTSWFVAALRSAKIAGLRVEIAGFQGAMNFLDKIKKSDRSAPTANADAKADPISTMAGAVGRLNMGSRRGTVMTATRWAAKQCREGNSFDKFAAPELVYFGTLANFHVGGGDWTTWNRQVKATLVNLQRKGGAGDGSKKGIDGSWNGGARGRVYSTAMGALCLEVYYRYLPIYSR